jgi:hypothetical protein
MATPRLGPARLVDRPDRARVGISDNAVSAGLPLIANGDDFLRALDNVTEWLRAAIFAAAHCLPNGLG